MEDEESVTLLENGAASKNSLLHEPSEPLSSHGPFGGPDHVRTRNSKLKIWLSGLALLLTLGFLVLYTKAFQSANRQAPFISSQTSQQDQSFLPQQKKSRLDIDLHPEQHVHRKPMLISQTWHITKGYRRPDGVKKIVYLVNDEFPGPTIEARSGDTLQITVQNDLEEDEGVAIHWHGLHMKDANDMDGAVGFTQSPISSGQNFTYNFSISDTQHGTFWWHSHYQVQRGDGLYGGLVVHRPASDANSAPVRTRMTTTSDQQRLLLIGDWYHRQSEEVIDWYIHSRTNGWEPVPDSVVINSHGAYNCSMAVRSRPLDCVQSTALDITRLDIDKDMQYRYRVVNTGMLAGFTLRIPGAQIQLIEVDGGGALERGPTAESVGILYPGERLDFILSWDPAESEQSGPSFLEIELDEENMRYFNPALALVHRFPAVGADPLLYQDEEPTSNLRHFNLGDAKSETSYVNATGFPGKAESTMMVYANTLILAHRANEPHGYMNQTSWEVQKDPPLPLISLPRSGWDKNQLVPFIESNPQAPTWIDLVINNLDDGSHPFHLHGYDFWVLSSYADGSYWGGWNPFEDPNPPVPLNTLNPVRKDTVYVPKRGYTVVRFRADNPGIWMFHCHVMWHQASGMVMAFQIVDGKS